MAPTYTHEFNHAGYKGKVEIPLGLYIDGDWHESADKNGKTIE
jgi:aldehyde dehydrogenase (NAD+)